MNRVNNITTTNEIGLIIIDNFGKLLVENNGNYIDIPRVTISDNQNKNELIEQKYNTIFEEKCPYFYRLSDQEDYRYDNVLREETKITYTYLITQSLPKNTKYKFLTLNHIDSLLSSLKKGHIKDELKVLLGNLKEIYSDSITLSDFSKKEYLEHLTDSFLTNKKENNLKEEYPFIDCNTILNDTLNFIKNIKKFNIDKEKNALIFQLEKIYPIKSFLKSDWYSDILLKLSKNNKEYLISTYLINSYFGDYVKTYIDDNEYDIEDLGEVKGLPQLVLYSKDLEMLNKVDNFEKIKKLNIRNNYFKRY